MSAEVNPAEIETSSAITFENIIIKSGGVDVNITTVVTDIDVYEHVDLPYLTATIALVDSEDLVSSMLIDGEEQITITVKTALTESKAVTKTFYLDHIMAGEKGNQNNEVFVLHLIEDVAYHSNLLNVNKAYTGKISTIISTIAKEYLGKEVKVIGSDKQSIKVIIPNMTPLKAMQWLKNKMTDENGFPFYMFSSLADDRLYLADLKSMMSASPSNDIPFSNFSSNVPDMLGAMTPKRRTILGHSYRNNNDLYALIDKAVIGATYQYFDPTSNKTISFDFDIEKDVVKKLKSNKIADVPTFKSVNKFKGKSFNNIQSRTITNINGMLAFGDRTNSLDESKDAGQYKLGVINRAIDSLMKKNSITIVTYGIDFLYGHGNQTIGNVIDVRFARNVNDHPSGYAYDNKKSGKVLIYATRHTMRQEVYTTTHKCLKLDQGDVE